MNTIGFGLLVLYFCLSPLEIEWLWVLADLGISFGISVIFVILFTAVWDPVLARFRPERVPDPAAEADVQWILQTPAWRLALVPAEDGFFFVPLLWLGITPLSSAIAALLFAAAHYPGYPARACVTKFVTIFCTAFIVLPHGLGTVITAHLIADVLSVAALHFVCAQAPTALPEETASPQESLDSRHRKNKIGTYFTLQIFTRLSVPPDASHWPSVLNARAVTVPRWALIVFSSLPSATFQILMS